MQGRDKFLASIFNQRTFRDQLSAQIAKKAGVAQSEVYVDVPTAPSVPVSSTRESFKGITVVSRRDNGSLVPSEIGIEQMPLIRYYCRVYGCNESLHDRKKPIKGTESHEHCVSGRRF